MKFPLMGGAIFCACILPFLACAQEVVGAKADPAEISVGSTSEIVVDFRSLQQASAESPNPAWRCGLNVNFGDGKSEFHRIDNKQAPFKLTHKYDVPGNYAVTFEGKTQFQGFNTVLSCSGQSRSVAVVVRPDDFAAREAAERAAKEDALKRAAADREAADRAAGRAKLDRQAAERAAQKASNDRVNAGKSALPSGGQTQAPKPASPALVTDPKPAEPKPRTQPKAGSAMDL